MNDPAMSAHVGWFGINLYGWLTISAIAAGPILALTAQRVLDALRAQRQRKLTVFKELMATRAARLSPRHVEALNAIEVEFAGTRAHDRAVYAAWRLYLNHLDSHPPEGSTDAEVTNWRARAADLVYALLHTMSQSLGFNHDIVSLKNNVYAPKAHGDLENDQQIIRKALVNILEGKGSFPISIVAAPHVALPENKSVRDLPVEGTSASGFRR